MQEYKCYGRSCRNEATVDGTTYTGGIAGKAEGVEGIQFCSNTGVITSSASSVGGLAGQGTQVENSYNTGTVNGSSRIGGLLGVQDAGYGVNKSYNQGTIVGRGNQAGGLVGYKNAGGYIRDSYNQGDVTSASSGQNGGIMGYSGGQGTVVEKVYNLGTVTGVTTLGGITGYILTTTENDLYKNVYNIGTVVCTNSNVGGDSGGIIGSVNINGSFLKIENAYNAGTVRDGNANAICSSSVQLVNVYYLAGVGIAQGTVKSEAELRSTEMVDLLNGTQDPKVWIKSPGIEINRGFPMFEFYPGRGELIRDEVPPTVIYTVVCSGKLILPIEYPPYPPVAYMLPPCAPHTSNLYFPATGAVNVCSDPVYANSSTVWI